MDEKDEVREILEGIVHDAEKWSRENGLSGEFLSRISANETGFVVEITAGRKTASCFFRGDGKRSMYILC